MTESNRVEPPKSEVKREYSGGIRSRKFNRVLKRLKWKSIPAYKWVKWWARSEECDSATAKVHYVVGLLWGICAVVDVSRFLSSSSAQSKKKKWSSRQVRKLCSKVVERN